MWQSILAVIAAPIAYGLCLPLNQIVFKSFPDKFDDKGITTDSGLLVLLLLMSFVYLAFSGYVSGWIAPGNYRNIFWIVAGVQLAIGLFVQSQFWNLLPLWYHLGFLFAVPVMVFLGMRLRVGSFL